MKIGIFDYGIGGVSLYKRLRNAISADIIYLSDTGYVPYGKVPESELRQRVQKVTDYLFEQGAERIVIACNSASTVAPDDQRVINMIPFGIEAVRKTTVKSLGIVGGYRTIESELYKQPLLSEMTLIRQEVAQVLSIRMEAGDLHSLELDQDIHRIFQPLADCEGILLACTHYPALNQRIQPVVPDAQLIDPMELLVETIFKTFPPMNGNKTTQWQTTGSTEKMQVAASRAFGVTIDDIQFIQL